MSAPLLEIDDLWVDVNTRDGAKPVLRGVDLTLAQGETLGLVGESGSGKSMTCQAVMRLLDPRIATITSGSVKVEGEELTTASAKRMRALRGSKISMILQDPHTSLNPAYTIGWQIREALALHGGLKGRKAQERSVELLDMMRIPDPARRLRNYPHELSGGTKQRVVAAIALASEPDLLIADEPTTALDVTVQAAFLALLKSLQREWGFGLVFVTHDLGLVNAVCDRVAVMYGGQVVESAETDTIFTRARHPYSSALLDLASDVERIGERPVGIPGAPPTVGNLAQGCSFRPRCAHASEACLVEPKVELVDPRHLLRCWSPISEEIAS